MRKSFPRSNAAAVHQRGSAYVIALLALVVLTVLGLALALITQSELQMGANERIINRVFYASDTGMAFASSKALLTNDYKPAVFDLPDSVLGSAAIVDTEVDVSAFYPILRAPCNLCEINNEGNYGSKDYKKINHAVSAESARASGGGTAASGEKLLSQNYEVQPWKATVDQMAFVDDPNQLAKIKF